MMIYAGHVFLSQAGLVSRTAETRAISPSTKAMALVSPVCVDVLYSVRMLYVCMDTGHEHRPRQRAWENVTLCFRGSFSSAV